MFSLGSADSPVTIRAQSDSNDFRIASSYNYGTLQVDIDQAWRSICLPSNVSGDYTSLSKLAVIACKNLGYSRGYYSSRVWYPSLGTPIIMRFSCPGNATNINHCTFRSGQYSSSARCLTVYYVNCYDRVLRRWAGIRFSPTSTVPVSGNSHQLPFSVLQHTLIEGAGRWGTRSVPSVQVLLKSPTFLNVTIKDSTSKALSFEYLHEEANLTGVVVEGSQGDGISFRGPRTRNLVFHETTVRDVIGSGIRVYRASDSWRGLTMFQSICSAPAPLNVSVGNGTYFGLHQDDHLAGIYCSVELRGPPNTILSLTLVSAQLYSDDRLVLRNGPSSSSSTIRTYSGYNSQSIDDSLLSSGNSVFVEITTGSKSSAPGFALYSVALSTRPGRPSTRITDADLLSVGTGIYISSSRDDIFISKAKVENISREGIYVNSHYGLFSFRDSIVRNSRSFGLYISYGRGDIEVLNNFITESFRDGIYIYGYDRYGQLTRLIDSNRVSKCGNSGLRLYSYNNNQRSQFGKWNVTRNVFDSNTDGVSVSSSNSILTDIAISKNSFLSHTRFGLNFDRSLNSHASIDGNTFVGHRGTAGGAMLLQGTAQRLTVTRNSFLGNSGEYVIKLSPYPFTMSPFVFRSNRMINNTVNFTEQYASDNYSAVAVVSMSSRIIMENNEFTNPGSQFELGIQLPVQSSLGLSVNVSSNYWGTTDEATIRDRIADFGYCSRLASADYFPYLTSPSGPAVPFAFSRDASILRPNSIVRGRVFSNTTIPLSGSPYTVVGDITILREQTLVVEAGVELRFTANTGIMIEGRLLAQGTESLPIKFVDDSLVVRSSSSLGSIRLNGAVPYEGVAQVYYNGKWEALCALQDVEDRFYQTNHNHYLSNVVCRELGYVHANWLWPPSRYVNYSHPRDTWLEHLICRGSESVLRQCLNYVFQKSKCHLGALRVSCWTGSNNQVQLKQQQQSWLHWSGIRFSQSLQQPSVLSHVFLSSAGYANAERVAAIQVVGHRLVLEDINVTRNAWTGVEVINSPAPDITRLGVLVNEGTGLRLSNTLSSALKEVTAVENRGHGLELLSGNVLQSYWNYPVLSPVDICSQSGKLSAATPFYLRYAPKLMQRGSYSQICRVDIQADPNHILSFDIMAVQFQDKSSKVVIDGKTIFASSGIQLPGGFYHFSTESNDSFVSIHTQLSDSNFDAQKNFVLIYVQQHIMIPPSDWSHTVSGGRFSSNLLSGIAFNSSQSTYDRSSISVEGSVISNNSWHGVEGNVTNGGKSGYGSFIRNIKIIRSAISNNGRFTTASYAGRAAGIAISADTSNIVIQNNDLTDNNGGAVSLNLTTRQNESISVKVFDNRIVRNKEGGTMSVLGSSCSAGLGVNICSNTIDHNSAGILYDTLAINSAAATVAGNTFYNNTGRHVVYWKNGQCSSDSEQTFINNTLHFNVGETPNERWTVSVVGVGPKYAGNAFTNPANQYEFFAGTDLGQGHHDAVGNWWGSRYLSEAEKRVRDKDDVSSLAAADIKPIVKEPPWIANGGCQYGWTLEAEWDFYCYLYVKGAMGWDAANSFCQSQGAHLGSVHGASVNTFLNSLIPRPLAPLTSAGAWLGLRNDGNKWLWSDRTDFDYGSVADGSAGDCLKLTSSGWEIEDCTTYLPFFCSKPPALYCPNACSQHGQCDSRTRTCSCFRGWLGKDCSDFHCHDVNDCSGYGTCVGPNQCRCRVGWKGRSCTTTYCNLYLTCEACTRQPGCGWCDSQATCIPGQSSTADAQQCDAWFYYSCYSPHKEGCSDRIKDIGCAGPCDGSAALSSNETCQHCHDIDRCYYEANAQPSCSVWNELKCPYGRVTPDYGFGANSTKVPSHLPNGKSDVRSKRSLLDKSSSDRRRKYVDLYPDVRVDSGSSTIYRLLGTSDYNYYITTPSLKDVETGHIFSSRQSGGILDKILAVTKWGAYQLIKASPAYLEETIKYADFIDNVDLEDVYDEAAVEIIPNVTAFLDSQLSGASETIVLSSSVPVYKCRRTSSGNTVVAVSSAGLDINPLSNQGVVSAHGSGFLEEVKAIVSAGPHTIVHTSLANCSRSLSVKFQVKTAGPSAVNKVPIVTGVGGAGVEGVVFFESVSPSGLDLSVGDVIVGRPSAPFAGFLVDFYGSFDGSTAFMELDSFRGARALCRERNVVGSPGANRQGSGRHRRTNVKWCGVNETAFFYHDLVKAKIGKSDQDVISTEAIISYEPEVEMTFRSNHTSPFVTKLGFSFKGPIHIGTSADLQLLPSLKGSLSLSAVSVNARSKPFCISVGPICIRGKTKLSAVYSFAFDYDVPGPSSVFFSYLSQSRGKAELGAVWRNGVGTEYLREAQLSADQDLADHPQYSSQFESSLSPTFGITWPSSYEVPAHVAQFSIPAVVSSAFSASPSLYHPSSYTVEISPSLKSQFETTRCSKGCDFGKKLLASLRAGVDRVEEKSFVDLLYYNSSQKRDTWQRASFIKVTTGLCLPLIDETDCPCECPGAASCYDFDGKFKICQPCSCSGLPGCSCTQACPAGTIEIFSSHLSRPVCRCQCSDFDQSNVRRDGSCRCGCTCSDGSKSVVGPNGQCDCGCKCNNCMNSVLGPSGCICLDDKCPECPEGLEPVWQDCTCSCQSKQGSGGLPPVCADGWKGPFCDVPDCSPWPFCSDNGICTIPMGSERDRKPYCVCGEQWIGLGCQFARPRPGGGDPHLQTLDGFSYDFFDIGEFWYCRSISNDFGLSTRFFKYNRASLIGAVAIKAGPSIVTIFTPHQPNTSDLPVLRLNGVMQSLSDGLELSLAKDTVHVEVSLTSSSESIALISFQYSNGVSLSVDVRYSAAMKRQFVNILFAPVASFKRSTGGLCGLMDGNVTNDLVGSDGVTYARAQVLDFAKSWRIKHSFDGSGLNGTWSWNHSNFHKNDTLDLSYTDPSFVPVYSIKDVDFSSKLMAESLCKQQGLDGVRLQECVFDVAITNDTTLSQQETYKPGCPTQCSGKGRCVNSTCVCIPGWYGEDCNLGSCANCSLNGDCVSGFCECHFGWDGVFCDKPANCSGVFNCTSPAQGRCKSHDVCECTVGFTGYSCNEKANCSRINNCSNHGGCVAHDKCKCDYGWAGVSCDRYSCETVDYCSNHGSCVGLDKCVCTDGWRGSSCLFPTCSKVGDCSGNGDCVAPNNCSCYGGYSGIDCATPTSCPELSDCSGNGVCLAQNGSNYCFCYAGYIGDKCNLASCFGQNNCSGNGACIEVDLCECDYGYSGSDCSNFSCEAKTFCSGRGKCVGLDLCSCDSKWTGPDCNTPDCSGVSNCGNASSGVCIGPDTCQCTAEYDGPRCDQLAGLNQHSPTFNVSSIDVAVSMTAAVGFVVASESAIDADTGKNARITYSLTSTNGGRALFKVNPQTGVIATAVSLRKFVGSAFLLTLTATDGGMPSLASSLQISLTVIQPNLHCPLFVGLPSSVSVHEMASLGASVVQVTAVDKDGNASLNGIAKYSLDASTSDLFTIDSRTGLVTLARSLTDDSYALSVIASDLGQPPCHTRGNVQVNVLLSNHAPQCIPESLTTSVPYTTSAGTVLFRLKATDVDSGAAGRLMYNLTNFESSSVSRNLFDLVTSNSSAKAEVAIRSPPSIPSGSFSLARLSVTAQDQTSKPKSCTFFLTVTITSHQFEFVSAKGVARLNESTPVKSIVPVTPPMSVRTTLNASHISYSLYNAESLPFSVHEKTGILSVSKSLDYEEQKEYNVSILAHTSEVPGAVTVTTVRVSVSNVNDNAPEFDRRQYTVFVSERATGGDLLLTLTATDADVNLDRTQIEYQLVSIVPKEAKDVFTTGAYAGGFQVFLSNDTLLNYDVTRAYSLIIRALDKQNPSLFDQATVVVSVVKAKVKWPLFTQEQYSATLQENARNGSSVLQVEARVEGDPNVNVTYSIRSQKFASGSLTNAFTITSSGVLEVANSLELDYEKVRKINVLIVASVTEPVTRTSEATAVISLSDANDNAPIFSKDIYKHSIVIGSPAGFSVINVSATDRDSGSNGEVTYRIEPIQEYFTIDSLTGEVSLARELDSEADWSYELEVSATDGGKPSLRGSSTISLTLLCSPATGQCPHHPSHSLYAVIVGTAVGGGVILIALVITIVVFVVVARKNKRKREFDVSVVMEMEQKQASASPLP